MGDGHRGGDCGCFFGLLGTVLGLWVNRENPTLVESLEGRVATLTAERDAALAVVATKGADLSA